MQECFVTYQEHDHKNHACAIEDEQWLKMDKGAFARVGSGCIFLFSKGWNAVGAMGFTDSVSTTHTVG